MKVTIKLFGKPHVKIDGQLIEVSLKKSEALLYYIAYEKRVSRDELAGLIWCDVPDVTAKKNLRNSLYRLKKDLDFELFDCPNKHMVEMGKSVDIEIDIDGDEHYFLEQYQGRFLEAFAIKEAEGFEKWRLEVENALNQKYLKLAQGKIDQLIQAEAYDEALAIATVMHRIDEYDELSSRQLMTLHYHMGQYKQITEVYNTLKTLLDEEMGIQPDKVTRDHYYSLIYSPKTDEKEQSAYFGRLKEAETIERTLHQMAIGQNRQSIIVSGEAGVGKTKLLESCLSRYKSTFKVLKATCYPAESGYAYKAWNDIFMQLSGLLEEQRIEIPIFAKQVLTKFFPGFDEWSASQSMENPETINSDYLEKLTMKLFDRLLKKTRLIVYVDDLQWMDPMSLRLLLSLVHHVEGFAFVATVRNEFSETLDDFMGQLYKYDRMLLISLDRFSEEESYAFMDYLTDHPLSSEQKKQIYNESEGNAFFIVEGSVAIQQDLADRRHRFKGILDSRFIGLDAHEVKLISMLSMFFDELDFELLCKLYITDEDTLLETIQSLKRRYLIKEIEGETSLKIKFTHHKLREHVYSQTPATKKRILHNRIGSLLEEGLSGDSKDLLLYQKLIYHYESAGNNVKHLTYYLKYLKAYFDFSHELYPEVSSQVQVVMDRHPEDYFKELELIFDRIDEDAATLTLKGQFVHMKARYFIRNGAYEEGMYLVDELIKIASESDDEELLFKAYVQWFYYLIQTEHTLQMPEVIEKLSGLHRTLKNDAVLLRLMGISSLMSGRYEEARVYFSDSIVGFEKLGKSGRYMLNIAAAYNYISEAFRRQNRLEEALTEVERAIELCKLQNIIRGGSIFNTNAGIIAFQMGEEALAKHYFEEALRHFETVDTLWRRSEAEGYLGVILVKNGHETRGRHYLAEAKKHAYIMGTPETIKLIESLENTLIG